MPLGQIPRAVCPVTSHHIDFYIAVNSLRQLDTPPKNHRRMLRLHMSCIALRGTKRHMGCTCDANDLLIPFKMGPAVGES